MSRTRPFRRSWQLFCSSLRVPVRSPRLLWFPVVTFLCTLAIACFFFAPVVLLPSGHPLNQSRHWLDVANFWGSLTAVDGHTQRWHPNALACLYLAAIYLVSMVCGTFFNVAFYHEILNALAGGPVSIRAGLAFARRRLRSIVLWSLFAGGVGLALRFLEERFGFVGRLVVRLVGVGWSVASVFAIPVMIREERASPLVLLRNSAATLRRTWGEALIGYVGIGLGTGLAVLGAMLFLAAGIVLAAWLHLPALGLGAAGIGLLAVVGIGYVGNIANDIYRCALYVYASEGVVPEPYTTELLDAAWKVRKA